MPGKSLQKLEGVVSKKSSKDPAVLLFSASLLDENQEIIDHIANMQLIPARHGRKFEGSKIKIVRELRESGPSDLTACFKIIL